MFSLNWFKSKKQREIQDLEHEIRLKKLQKELESVENPPEAISYNIGFQEPNLYEKPYKTVKMVNDVLTVVFNNGDIIVKVNATAEDFENVRLAIDEEEVMDVMKDQKVHNDYLKLKAEREKAEALKEGIKTLCYTGEFKVDGDSVYFQDINRSIPQLMVERLVIIAKRNNYVRLQEDEEFVSLKRFFMWCCLNPRAEVADKLYNFLMKNSFRITKQGFFAALRNVVTLHGGTELVQFVSNAYNKVKAIWKKSPDNYTVFLKDGEYRIVDNKDINKVVTCEDCDGTGEYWDEEENEYTACGTCDGDGDRYDYNESEYGEKIGNLTELYLDLPNRSENRFTDAHTKTFDIRVGKPVSMDPGACRWNTDDCGAEGLHFTANEIHYVGCGDQSVLVLINPMKVVGIGESKGRCWEYLPIMTVSREEATEILHDLEFDTLQLDDAYAIRELEGLANRAKEGFVTEAKKHAFNMPPISHAQIDNIVESLEGMKAALSSRIQIID